MYRTEVLTIVIVTYLRILMKFHSFFAYPSHYFYPGITRSIFFRHRPQSCWC